MLASSTPSTFSGTGLGAVTGTQVYLYPQGMTASDHQTVFSSTGTTGDLGLQIQTYVNLSLSNKFGIKACFAGGCTSLPGMVQVSRY